MIAKLTASIQKLEQFARALDELLGETIRENANLRADVKRLDRELAELKAREYDCGEKSEATLSDR